MLLMIPSPNKSITFIILMKKLWIGLLLNLLIPTYCLSKPIYPDTVLTKQDYKKIALLLNEHNLYKEENVLLKNQVSTYKELVKSYNKTDSVYKEQTKNLWEEIDKKDKQIKHLNSSIKVVKYSSVATIVGVILCLILK